MVIHHMADGTVRNSIEGLRIPKSFEGVYKIANRRREIKDGNNNKSRIVKEK